MGYIKSPKYCYFTQLETFDVFSEEQSIDYFIEFDGKKIFFRIDSYFETNRFQFTNDELFALKCLIFNGLWNPNGKLINSKEIEQVLSSTIFPRNPQEKLDNLLFKLHSYQEFEGEELVWYKHYENLYFVEKLYFRNKEECNFYLKTLEEMGLLQSEKNADDLILTCNITFKGLNYFLELNNVGKHSKNCFVAMSFGENMAEIRTAIKTALIENGYYPILIDELHFKSDRTINDEIISNIKRSSLCIADFTEQRDGVYFEAGFALGRGLTVIYTCHDNWFKETHFDTNHFPHIIYKNATELSEKLKIKIEAWL
jgi:nucleoside 2-deoxyribosyltransferase